MQTPQPKIAKAPEWSDGRSITFVIGLSVLVIGLLFGAAGHAGSAPPEQVLISTR